MHSQVEKETIIVNTVGQGWLAIRQVSVWSPRRAWIKGPSSSEYGTLPHLNASDLSTPLILPGDCQPPSPPPHPYPHVRGAPRALPMRSMKLLKDWLLMFVSVSFMASAKSARSARCCQRSLSDFSSCAGSRVKASGATLGPYQQGPTPLLPPLTFWRSVPPPSSRPILHFSPQRNQVPL